MPSVADCLRQHAAGYLQAFGDSVPTGHRKVLGAITPEPGNLAGSCTSVTVAAESIGSGEAVVIVIARVAKKRRPPVGCMNIVKGELNLNRFVVPYRVYGETGRYIVCVNGAQQTMACGPRDFICY